MQELATSIELAAHKDTLDQEALRDSAKKWASFCLTSLNGDLLKRGLDVSAAIASFCNEFEAQRV